ncbi:MAG: hypothetical protein OES79_05340 [Planctomycetota bacterium]|nr:hypothetical protein [Planctomycetota bacterium]
MLAMLLCSFQHVRTTYGTQISHGLQIFECESSTRLTNVEPARGELSKKHGEALDATLCMRDSRMMAAYEGSDKQILDP